MKKQFLLATIICCLCYVTSKAQKLKISPNPYYNLIVTKSGAKGVPLQSFINGRKGDTIVFIGGRTKGLHNFSGTAFPFSTSNTRLQVWCPNTGGMLIPQLFSAPVPTSFTKTQQLQLSSTNMQFCQEEGIIYACGGYGFQGIVKGDSTYGTFNGFFAVDAVGLINAIVTGDTLNNSHAKYFTFSKQPNASDSTMAVTGGELVKMGDDFYLVMGNDFQGEYGGKGKHLQRYIDAFTRFHVDYTPGSLKYTILDKVVDSNNFHRRDLNIMPVIANDGEPGIDVYGGVFTKNTGPWLNPVKIRMNPQFDPLYFVDTNLTQYFNLYACAHVQMYDKTRDYMYTSFLGGISLYDSVKTLNAGIPIQSSDTSMPWSNVISSIVRDANGKYVEYAADKNNMPQLIGGEARFIPKRRFLRDDSEEIIDYNKVLAFAAAGKTKKINIGFMIGGIIASSGQGSTASDPAVYDVMLEIKLIGK